VVDKAASVACGRRSYSCGQLCRETCNALPLLLRHTSPTLPFGQVARLIGLEPQECERPEFALLFSGAAPLPGAAPYAQNYGATDMRCVANGPGRRSWFFFSTCIMTDA
jgi:hypothetical protein